MIMLQLQWFRKRAGARAKEHLWNREGADASFPNLGKNSN
jgi:hypothetical protein